jgi:peptide/nickel transport system substrate-binding protein
LIRLLSVNTWFRTRLLILCIALPALQCHGAWLTFSLDAPDDRAAEAELIASQLAEAGIKATVVLHRRTALRNLISGHNRQAYLTDWGSSFFDPFDLVVPKLKTGGKGNFSRYSNPQVDALLIGASTSLDDRIRQEDYFKVQRILAAQTPWAFGYLRHRFEAASITVRGYQPASDSRINLHDVWTTSGQPLLVALNTSAFVSLDPAAFRDRETETVIRNMFDALVTRTPAGEVVPELADHYSMPDPTTYEFHLRPGVLFHHGSPLTADDVVFTFERILNPFALNGFASPRRDLLGPLRQVVALDPDTVRFHLEQPFPLFLQALVHFQIVPKDYIKQHGVADFALHPSGTGPFRFLRGQLDREVVLEPFSDYYGGSPSLPPVGPPRLKGVSFVPLADAEGRLSLLMSQSPVIITDVPDNQVEALRLVERVQLLSVNGTRSFQLEFNNSVPPFDDIRLRKAVALAIDWPRIIDQIYLGHGRQLATCFLPGSFGFDPDLAPVARDLDTVTLLLQEAELEPWPGPDGKQQP